MSTFSIERVNGIPLWDFNPSDFQRALKIIIIAELFIVMTISPGQLRHNNSDNAENAHSRLYVLKVEVVCLRIEHIHIRHFACFLHQALGHFLVVIAHFSLHKGNLGYLTDAKA